MSKHIKNPLTRETLMHMGCSQAGCEIEHNSGIFYFHARCHPSGKTWTYYDKERNTVTIQCAVCRKAIAEVAVHH